MKILVFGINYAPELTGIGKYTGEMCAWLAASGHKVEVVTAMPYYPEWQVHAAYKGKRWMTEMVDGVKVHRVPLYVPEKVRARSRILHEISFELAILPVWCKLLFTKRADVVLNVAPPFHLGFYAWAYAWMKGASLVTHIQDLQVDAAHDLGMIKSKKLTRLMFGLERFILKRSALVTSISEGMMKKILKKGISCERFYLFPNWVDGERVYPLPKEQSLRSEWNLALTDKVVLYSGNLGNKQGLEVILDCAVHYQYQRDVYFVIVGSGGVRQELMRQVEQRCLKNILFFPLQPYEKMSALLATADIHLVLQRGSASDLVMPSKFSAILAAGGFAILNAVKGSSLYELAERHGIGHLVEPDSIGALIRGIGEALEMDREKIQERARTYARAYLDKEQVLRAFEDRLLGLVDVPQLLMEGENNITFR